jgi:hypothetical protein
MLDKESHVNDLWYANHRKDNLKHTGSNYQEKLFERTISHVMFENDTLNEFLIQFQKLAVMMIDSNLVIRNFWNYTVSKYYDKHNN